MSYIKSKHHDVMDFVSYVKTVARIHRAERLSEVAKWATMTENILKYVESVEEKSKMTENILKYVESVEEKSKK